MSFSLNRHIFERQLKKDRFIGEIIKVVQGKPLFPLDFSLFDCGKTHGNRQRRYVKLIDDFERDLAEEGISLDDIEEEVDLERPLDEDDLIITSDEIYDLVHSNMEFFDNPSEPVEIIEMIHHCRFLGADQDGVSEGRSAFKIVGSRASGLIFFPCHSRNGWRKNPAPLVPDRTVDGVARRLSPTVGRIRSLACAGVFFVLESSKLEIPSLSERYEPGF
ncbi:hypothetical protein PRIPAC_96255 [Pristionchus pacificus]|uniref:Uncharacterized protein n=1 Tax=Pristionchus pacificus TaxID=54126 RepID=A0A2A6CUP0_PRIPA|nr:hypothetical protein PRIPAC_96255 [Pristionchus pacificus]|eukprot:PDM81838.1 hypothetical protein PRIPAC_33992 [Pristionchus pacificus]